MLFQQERQAAGPCACINANPRRGTAMWTSSTTVARAPPAQPKAEACPCTGLVPGMAIGRPPWTKLFYGAEAVPAPVHVAVLFKFRICSVRCILTSRQLPQAAARKAPRLVHGSDKRGLPAKSQARHRYSKYPNRHPNFGVTTPPRIQLQPVQWQWPYSVWLQMTWHVMLYNCTTRRSTTVTTT